MMLLLVVGLSLISGLVRFIASAETHSIFGFCRGLTAAVFVGFNAYQMTQYYALNTNLEILVVCISAFVADYILVAILKVADEVSKRPIEFLREVFNRQK